MYRDYIVKTPNQKVANIFTFSKVIKGWMNRNASLYVDIKDLFCSLHDRRIVFSNCGLDAGLVTVLNYKGVNYIVTVVNYTSVNHIVNVLNYKGVNYIVIVVNYKDQMVDVSLIKVRIILSLRSIIKVGIIGSSGYSIQIVGITWSSLLFFGPLL